MGFENRMIATKAKVSVRKPAKVEVKTEVKTTSPEVAYALGEYETFWINGVKVAYDVDHTFEIAIHKDIAESKYQYLIDKGLLHSWDSDDELRNEWMDEDELVVRRQHYWHWSSLIHPVDDDDNYLYGEMEDEEHFKWLGIDENDTNEELNDIGNG